MIGRATVTYCKKSTGQRLESLHYSTLLLKSQNEMLKSKSKIYFWSQIATLKSTLNVKSKSKLHLFNSKVELNVKTNNENLTATFKLELNAPLEMVNSMPKSELSTRKT